MKQFADMKAQLELVGNGSVLPFKLKRQSDQVEFQYYRLSKKSTYSKIVVSSVIETPAVLNSM